MNWNIYFQACTVWTQSKGLFNLNTYLKAPVLLVFGGYIRIFAQVTPSTGRIRPYTVEAACRVRKVLPARSREEAEDFFYEEAGAVEDHFPEAVLEIISICEGE